ncbi:hypothetical protein [Streptomyces sp. 3213.3]|nr:hypothetical protein [Streptomyces sp. 3213.3]
MALRFVASRTGTTGFSGTRTGTASGSQESDAIEWDFLVFG